MTDSIFKVYMIGGDREHDNFLMECIGSSKSISIVEYIYLHTGIQGAKLINSSNTPNLDGLPQGDREILERIKKFVGSDEVVRVELRGELNGEYRLLRVWDKSTDLDRWVYDVYEVIGLLDSEIFSLKDQLEESRKNLVEEVDKLTTKFTKEYEDNLETIRRKLSLVMDLVGANIKPPLKDQNKS